MTKKTSPISYSQNTETLRLISTIVGTQLRSPHSLLRASSPINSAPTMHASLLGSQPEQPLHTFIQATTPIRAGDEGHATRTAPSSNIKSPLNTQLTGADTTPFRIPNSDLNRTLAGRIERLRTTGMEWGNNDRIANRGRLNQLFIVLSGLAATSTLCAAHLLLYGESIRRHPKYGRSAICRPIHNIANTPWKRILTYGRTPDFIVSTNSTKQQITDLFLRLF